MASEITELIKCKEGNFGNNSNNEPISVLDTWRSPSPSTSTSTISSSLGNSGNGSTTTTTTAAIGVSGNNLQQRWSDSAFHEMGISGSVPNLSAAGGGRKDDSPELQPIPAEFELQQQRFGGGLDNWESLFSESPASPAQDQSLLRWVSGDVDDTSFALKQFLQGNQVDENDPATIAFETPANFNPQNPNFSPFLYTDQKPPTPPPAVVQFQDQGFQETPYFDLGHQFLPNKQNQQQLLNQQKSLMVAPAKQPPPAAVHHHPHHNHQNQLICDHLSAAAEQMLSRNFSQAQAILARLNHQLSSTPKPHKPFQRAAFYFKEALQMQLASLISNFDPNCRIIPTPFNGMFKMGAYKAFSQVSPMIQFMNFTSNQTLLEVLDDAQNIHIIDFDIGFGAQWASFIQELPMRKNTINGGNCSLKITAFASPSTHHHFELGLMNEYLSQIAQEIGVFFELEVVNLDSFDPNSFLVSGNETIAVNFPIWSMATCLSSIPALLHFIKQLSPKIVVSLDRGCERTDLPFTQYLIYSLQYYEVLLDSIDAANISSETANKIETFLIQPQIESIVMGKLRILKPMPHWKTLFTASGYSPVLLSNLAELQADCLVKRTQVRGFTVERRQGSLVLLWQNRPLMTASAWKCR